MAQTVKEMILGALGAEGKGKEESEASTREVLVATLEMDKNVLDAMDGEFGKKQRGRPRKDECKAADPSKCWKHGFGHGVMKEVEKQKERQKGRLNPQPTRDLEKEWDLSRELRETGWDIEEVPDSKAETESMETDLDNLRREARMKSLSETYEPYAAYKKKWEEYGELKKRVAMLQKQAATFLKRRNYEEVEEMIATLKKQPQVINEKYQEILEAYENCCESLCDEIDKNGKEKGMNSAEALEAEKREYGMMPNENAKAYQKRMRAIGRTSEVPETVKRIDEIVAQTERRWRSVAGMGQEEFKRVKENFKKTFNTLMKGCSLASNLTIAGINGVLEEHLKSQHDLTKKGKMYDDGSFSHNAIIGGMTDGPRYKFAQKCFGVDKGLKESKYEKYGCLHTLTPRDTDNLMGGQYGKNVIRWKPHKSVATMTFLDSLCLSRDGLNYVTPCLVTDPSPCCFNPENKAVVENLRKKPMNAGLEELCYLMGAPYCELQLHGEDQYDATAIESISFGSKNDVRNLTKGAIANILTNHIPIYIGEEAIEIDERGAIKRQKNSRGS